MTTKRLLGIVLTISCLALLAATVSTAAPTAKRGGTFVFEISTDVDYIDPQLSYYGETWKLEAATACKLMNWQDKEGAAGAVATPEVAQGLPIVSRDGKTYTFTIKPGFRFSNGKPVTARSFVDSFNRFANPRMQSTGVQFLDIVQGAQAVIDGKAQDDLGRPGERQQVHRAPDEGVAGLPRPPDDAVHAGDRHDARRPDRRERDQPVRVVRAVLLLEPDAGALDHAQAEPVLQGRAGGEPRHDPGERRQRHRRPVPERRAGHVRLRVDAASRRPSGRTSSRSTASTGRTGASRCGRCSTSATWR